MSKNAMPSVFQDLQAPAPLQGSANSSDACAKADHVLAGPKHFQGDF